MKKDLDSFILMKVIVLENLRLEEEHYSWVEYGWVRFWIDDTVNIDTKL
jgi:hypothetical protein